MIEDSQVQELFKDKDVAIIGSSKSLFDKKDGSEIDKHEVVVRINKGVVIKDADSQGRKTDIWCFGVPNQIKSVLTLNEEIIQCTLHVGRKGRQYDKSSSFIPNKFISLDTINRLCDKLGYKYQGYWKPSTGLIVLYSILECFPRKASVYGFDFNGKGAWYGKNINKKKFFRENEEAIPLIDDEGDLIPNQRFYQPHNWDLEKDFFYEDILTRAYNNKPHVFKK